MFYGDYVSMFILMTYSTRRNLELLHVGVNIITGKNESSYSRVLKVTDQQFRMEIKLLTKGLFLLNILSFIS